MYCMYSMSNSIAKEKTSFASIALFTVKPALPTSEPSPCIADWTLLRLCLWLIPLNYGVNVGGKNVCTHQKGYQYSESSSSYRAVQVRVTTHFRNFGYVTLWRVHRWHLGLIFPTNNPSKFTFKCWFPIKRWLHLIFYENAISLITFLLREALNQTPGPLLYPELCTKQ